LSLNFRDLAREVEIMDIINHHCVLGICEIVDPESTEAKPDIVLPSVPNTAFKGLMAEAKKRPITDCP
jgi:hypothetical protein